MCTAICINGKKALFGRTLDLEDSLGAELIITPRNYYYKNGSATPFSMIGMGVVCDNSVLYFDAMNEAGLWCAALNFPTVSVYRKANKCKLNLASYEILPYILANFTTVSEVRSGLTGLNITDEAFSPSMPPTPLHWIASDGVESITVESTDRGVRIIENPAGVLTNSPDFYYHMTRLSDCCTISARDGKNRLTDFSLTPYSRGLGAMGLPGDFSSSSRFIRAVYLKQFTLAQRNKNADISRVFHILDGVSVPDGCIITREGRPVRTVYSSVACPSEKAYYFTSYGCRTPRVVRLFDNSNIINGESELRRFPLECAERIESLN